MATKITTISPHLKNIRAPLPLYGMTIWLLWKFVPNGDKKPRKVPFYVGGGKRQGSQGSDADRKQLVDFPTALEAAVKGGFDGVGVALLHGNNLVALDFDDCVADGVVDPAVADLVSGTYAEYSPSGNGVRAFFWGDLGNHKSHSTSEQFGFEVFSSTGFVTLTGKRLDIVDLLGDEDTVSHFRPLNDPVRALCEARFGRAETVAPIDDDPLMAELPLGLTDQQLQNALTALPDDLTYDEWVKVGMAIHFETSGEGFELWESWSQSSPKYSTREYNEERWQSFGRRGGRQVTARTLVQMANARGAGINVSIASMEEFDNVASTPNPEEISNNDPPQRFTPTPHDLFTQRKPLSQIIKGFLPAAELIVLYGESTAGKTFVALDIAFAVARGVAWRGLRVKQGRVVYIAAEGVGGVRKRLEAYAQHYGVTERVPLDIISDTPNLLEKLDALALAKAIAEGGPTSLVIVDTFAQTTAGGNENSGEDMSRALAHCKGIHKATGATVMLVHHAGKDLSKGARGWSGLRAAADAEIEVSRSAMGRAIRQTKNKDGDDSQGWGFDLETVVIGMDEDGDAITSCVVRDAPLPTTGVIGRGRKMGVWESLVAEVLAEFSLGGTAGIEVDAAIAEAVRRSPAPEEGKRDERKKCARRALNSLCTGDDSPYFLEDDGTVTML